MVLHSEVAADLSTDCPADLRWLQGLNELKERLFMQNKAAAEQNYCTTYTYE